MPNPKLNYEIVAPNTIVEASFSKQLDDRSQVDFTIEVSNPVRPVDAGGAVGNENAPVAGIELKRIRFEVPASLSTNPRGINPVVREPGWTLKRKQDGANGTGAIFEATPQAGTFTVKPGEDQSLGFRLLNVEIAEGLGLTHIAVEETAGDDSVGATNLRIRKVAPELRIDSFTASSYAVQAVRDSDNTVTLSWATTGATEIVLEQATSGRSTSSSFADPSFHDATVAVHPKGTTTYTLKAKGNSQDAMVVAQVTITVTNNDAARPGTIVAWSRMFDGASLPDFWVLCDGSEYTDDNEAVAPGQAKTKFKAPDLRGRFIRCAVDATDELNPPHDSAGSVKLTEAHIPLHDHAGNPDGAHRHLIAGFGEGIPRVGEPQFLAGTSVTIGSGEVPKIQFIQRGGDYFLMDTTFGFIEDHFEVGKSHTGSHTHAAFGKRTADQTAIDTIPHSIALAYIVKLKPHMTKVNP